MPPSDSSGQRARVGGAAASGGVGGCGVRDVASRGTQGFVELSPPLAVKISSHPMKPCLLRGFDVDLIIKAFERSDGAHDEIKIPNPLIRSRKQHPPRRAHSP